ncbi:hypothetical protein Bbelb_067100 [Branchiostoma belcheri]|nr:hypothetical protein Bbelb_067100 [Branchiostoma belcheri]
MIGKRVLGTGKVSWRGNRDLKPRNLETTTRRYGLGRQATIAEYRGGRSGTCRLDRDTNDHRSPFARRRRVSSGVSRCHLGRLFKGRGYIAGMVDLSVTLIYHYTHSLRKSEDAKKVTENFPAEIPRVSGVPCVCVPVPVYPGCHLFLPRQQKSPPLGIPLRNMHKVFSRDHRTRSLLPTPGNQTSTGPTSGTRYKNKPLPHTSAENCRNSGFYGEAGRGRGELGAKTASRSLVEDNRKPRPCSQGTQAQLTHNHELSS